MASVSCGEAGGPPPSMAGRTQTPSELFLPLEGCGLRKKTILRPVCHAGWTLCEGVSCERERVEGERRSPPERDVLTGVGGQGEREGGYRRETVS